MAARSAPVSQRRFAAPAESGSLRWQSSGMAPDGQCLVALPLKQYEVALQNAQHVMSCLLSQPARPWLCFGEVVLCLGQQAMTLHRRAAACRLQRAFRKYCGDKAAKAALQQTPMKVAVAPRVAARPLVTPPQPVGHPGAALNPVQKRRQLIASQLAATNPSRLARCHRASRPTPRPVSCHRLDAEDVGAAPQPSSAEPVRRSSGSASPRPPPSPRGQPPSPRRPMEQASNHRALIAAQLAAIPMECAARDDISDPLLQSGGDLRGPVRTATSSPVPPSPLQQVGRRIPPLPADVGTRRCAPDILLKEALLDDDPRDFMPAAGRCMSPAGTAPGMLESMSAGFSAGLSLAPPPALPHRPGSSCDGRRAAGASPCPVPAC